MQIPHATPPDLSRSSGTNKSWLGKKADGRALSILKPKQASFHVVISELRADLSHSKQPQSSGRYYLQWVRGEVIHLTEESVGTNILSWSDTYFAQVVTLQAAANGFRTKECKFKVQHQQPGALPHRDDRSGKPPGLKTVAKTAVLDIAKYCSESGLAREQPVSVPLQPCGTLYFVISTAPASGQNRSPSSNTSLQSDIRTSAHSTSQPQAATHGLARPSADAAHAAAAAHGAAHGASLASASVGGAGAQEAGPGGGRVGRGNSGRFGLHWPPLGGTRQGASKSTPDGRASGGGGGGAGAAAATAAAAAGAVPTARGDGGPADPGGMFRKRAHRSAAAAGDAAAASAADKTWDVKSAAERLRGAASAAAAAVTGDGAAGAPSGAAGGGMAHRRGLSMGRALSRADRERAPSSKQLRSAPSAPHLRRSSSVGSGSGSDAAPPGPASPAAPAAAAPAAATANGHSHHHGSHHKHTASAGAGGGGGGAVEGGWSSWLRGWGRSPSHSHTGTGTTASVVTALSHSSLPPAAAAEADSSPLEAAIRDATEVSELRDLALDMLRERDEWRRRAVAAQDGLGRSQAARGSAVREAQRLEVRLREYQDELGRRTDGSLLQELVEAKVRIAELANENLRLRRQITHMGPLFYGDSDHEPPDARE